MGNDTKLINGRSFGVPLKVRGYTVITLLPEILY